MRKKSLILVCLAFGLVALTSTAALAMNIDVRIANGNDDVEEYTAAKNMYLTSSDLEIPYENDGTPPTSEQVIGLRWAVPLPQGAKILKAYVELTCDDPKGGAKPVNLIIDGQLTDNAPPFSDATADVTGRAAWTQAKVKWSVVNWTGPGQKAQTPDLTALLQEIINQPGWAEGNALVLALRDDKSSPSQGIRSAVSYEGGSAPALLHIEVFHPAAYAPNPTDGAVGVLLPLLKWTRGDGAMFHNVYLGKTPELTEANRVATKIPATTYFHAAGLEPGVQYYWRVDEVDAAGTVTPGFIWSFVMQAVTAYYPTPAHGSVDAAPTTALTWQPGRGAIKHHVYFADSLDAVTQGAADTDKGETLETTFTPTALDDMTSYYWRVDEIGVGGVITKGAVWSFTTNRVVDDFESYTDDMGSAIFDAWIDGFTDQNSNSTVGNMNAPFAEQSIVHSGKQSMPMDYNNVIAPFYSEARLEFAPTQSWTAAGAVDLRLCFRGRASNGAGSLYLVLEDSSGKSAVVTHPNAAAATTTTWTEWKIPLSSVTGVNLAKVKALCLGIGDRNSPVAGGAGRMYFDDIRLTK